MTVLFNVFSLKQLRLFLQWLFISRLFHLWRTGLRIQLLLLSLTWQCGVHTLQSCQMPLQRKKPSAVTSKLILPRIALFLVDALFHGHCYTGYLYFVSIQKILAMVKGAFSINRVLCKLGRLAKFAV